MSRKDELHLNRFAPYIRREDGITWASWGWVAGLGTAVLMHVAVRALPILTAGPRLALSLLIPAAVTLAGFAIATLTPRSSMDIARRSDARLRLRDRLTTAIEIEQGTLAVPPEIALRQRAAARAAAGRADPGRAFRLCFPARQARIAAVLLVLLVLGLALPNPQDARIAQRQAEQAAIEEQVARLEQVRQEIAAAEGMDRDEQEALLRELDESLRDLRQGTLSREEALARLSETEDQLRALRDDSAAAREAALREAGRQAAQGEHTQDAGQALAEGDLDAAAEAIASLGEQLPHLTGAERAATADRLDAMAAALAGTDPALAQALQDAAAAMLEGDLDAAREALDRAAAQAEGAGQQLAAQKALDQALGQVQEGRRALAQSGQGPGQQGSGQGQGQQGQSGSGTGSGSGDAEPGTGQGTPQDPGGPIPPNAPGREGETPYDPVYAPERLGTGEGETVRVEGQGEGGPDSGEVEGGPPGDGEALVPYDQVYADYQAQAASALEDSYIPRSVKAYVRAYFSSLDPEH